jgi:hypothetical protein
MIPTAAEFYTSFVIKHKSDGKTLDLMIEFAKLHVKEARKQFKIVFSEIDDPYPFERDDKLSDVYPLTNIV